MSSNSLFGASNSLGSSSTTRQQQAPTSFSSLLAQANSLNETDRDGELPQLRYGLEEIERLSETVAGKGKRAANSRGEGVQLLSNLGVNTAQLTHSVAQLPNAGDVTGARPKRRRQRVLNDNSIPDVGTSYNASQQDVGAWGRNLHETIILSGIEHQRQKTIKSFNDQFQARMLANWEMDKAKILQEELGVTDDEIAKLSSSALGSSTLGKSSLGASTRRFPSAHATATTAASKEGEFVMHTKMVRYERVISDLNSHRLRKAPYELCQAMAQAVKMDNRKEPAHDAFRILAYLTHEPSLSDTAQAEQIQERQYAQAYLGDPYSNHAAKLRGRLTTGGKRYLERDFESYVDETIANNPKEAALGGVPGIENKIRAFVSVLFAAKSNIKEDFKPEYVNDIPLWAQVYYLFRCGYPEEALELLSSKQNLLKREDMTLPGAFRAYLSSPSRKIPKAQKDQLQNDYNGYIKNNANVDQYKYALYRIIGRFDLGRGKVAVASTSTDDWVWLKLTLVREGREDNPSDHYDLAAFGDECWKNGSKTFDAKGTRPFTWVNILLFAGHFEPAIAYLYSRPQNRTDAVHLAIALQYYGLLHVSPPEDPLLTESEEEDVTSINFARLIKNYISPFARVEPQTALQYVYLVPLGSDAPDGVGERQRAVSLELIRDVVLASRAWGKLLGSVRADGSKETGVIEKDAGLLRLPESTDYFRQIVLSAAEQSALDSSLPDSIELYHLANAPDKVIETVNRALGSSLSLPSAQSGPLTSGGLGISGAFGGITDLTTLGERVRAVYDRDTVKRSKIQKGPWDTLDLLLQLKRALGEFGAGRPDLALESFKQTKLLPLDNNDSGSIQRSTGLFKALLDQPTISSLDEIIITTMKCLHQLSQQLKQSPYGDKGRMEQINRYKSMAQCLVQFASGMRLRLGPDVYRQLSSMSAFF